MLKSKLDEIREGLATPTTPFGVDLALPQIGGNARKTNTDYTQGKLDELIDIIIEAKPVLFVCAVGGVSSCSAFAPQSDVRQYRRSGSSTSFMLQIFSS